MNRNIIRMREQMNSGLFHNGGGKEPRDAGRSGVIPAMRAATTSMASEPAVTVYGSVDITLPVSMTVTESVGVYGNIALDTPHMGAFFGIRSPNNHMIGDFHPFFPA